jgi:cobaltochelatase CobN
MEEEMGDVTEEFQGSRVEVMTKEDVKVWNPKFKLDDFK